MRFFFRDGKPEVVFDELPYLLPDLFCVCTRANDPNAKVIRIPTEIESLVFVVERVPAW
jgi:hypothetical protein